jgi:hypothetical protein
LPEPRQTLGRYPLAVDSQADDPAFGLPGAPALADRPGALRDPQRAGQRQQTGASAAERRVRTQRGAQGVDRAAFSRARAQKLEGVVLIQQANPDIEDFSAGRRTAPTESC